MFKMLNHSDVAMVYLIYVKLLLYGAKTNKTLV